MPTGSPFPPELQQYMQQQRMQNWIGTLAQGLMQAGSGGEGFGVGALKALAGANAGRSDPMDMLRMQNQLEQLAGRKEDRALEAEQRERRDAFIMGTPGQLASAGGPQGAGASGGYTGGLPREQQALADAMGHENFMNAYAKQEFAADKSRRIVKGGDGYNYYADTGDRVLPGVEKSLTATEREAARPKTVKDAEGYQRYISGPRAGERAFPGVELQPDPTTATGPMKDALALGLQPGSAGYNDYIRERTLRAQTDVDVNLGDVVGDLGNVLTEAGASKRAVDLEDRRVATTQMAAQGANLISQLNEGGDSAISWTGGLSRGLGKVSSQGRALAREVGFDLNLKKFEFGGDLATKSSGIQSKMLGLAVALTKADQGSRPSDFDVQTSLNRLAAGSGSARTMATTIQGMLDEKMNDFAIDYRVRSGEDFDWAGELERNNIVFPEIPTEAVPQVAPEITQDKLEREMQKRGLLPGG